MTIAHGSMAGGIDDAVVLLVGGVLVRSQVGVLATVVAVIPS